MKITRDYELKHSERKNTNYIFGLRVKVEHKNKVLCIAYVGWNQNDTVH